MFKSILKSEARSRVKELRKELDKEYVKELSTIISKKVIELWEVKSASTVLLYNSINNEVDTTVIRKFCEKSGKNIAYPKVLGEKMEFYRADYAELESGYMGIPEPIPSEHRLIDVSQCNKGVIIVPGVAFDYSCNRTGYGKGYYDRYLAGHSGLTTIGLALSFQMFDNIETDEYDIGLDYVITENKEYRKHDGFD